MSAPFFMAAVGWSLFFVWSLGGPIIEFVVFMFRYLFLLCTLCMSFNETAMFSGC